MVLQCLDLNLGDPLDFPFVDPPEAQLVRDGIHQLRELDLVSTKGRLTPLGRRVARLPLDPRIGRILLDAETRRVFWEVSVAASALSIQDPREPGFSSETVIDPSSEFVTLLNLWNRVERIAGCVESLEISSMVSDGRAELQQIARVERNSSADAS